MIAQVLVLPMSISDMFKSAISLTTRISKSANTLTMTPSIAPTLGENNATISFRYPRIETAPISGDKRTVHTLVSH